MTNISIRSNDIFIIKEYDNGDKEWYNEEGKLHKQDGPAIEGIGGYNQYWYHGYKARNVNEFRNLKWRKKCQDLHKLKKIK